MAPEIIYRLSRMFAALRMRAFHGDKLSSFTQLRVRISSSRHTRSRAQDRELKKILCDNCVTLIPDSCETRSNQPPLLSTTCSTSSTYEKQGPRSACDAAMRSNQNNKKNSQYEYRADKQYRSHTTVVPQYTTVQ